MNASMSASVALAMMLAASSPLSANTVVDLQSGRQAATMAVGDADVQGTATLINLNPHVNAWYLLTLEWGRAGDPTSFHLENTAPRHQSLELDRDTRRGLVVRTQRGEFGCELWSDRTAAALEQARGSGVSYVPLCEGRLQLRNPSRGYRTPRELVTEFLRDRVWGGERLIDIVKGTLERDAHLERSAASGVAGPVPEIGAGPASASTDAPQPVLHPVPAGLGIELVLPTPGVLAYGQWYPAKGLERIHVSVMEPGLVSRTVLDSHPDRVRPLDSVESRALVYLVAFDLGQFLLGFEVGTDHPRVGWSERALPQVREAGPAPGPDGFDTIAPLVATGIVNPTRVSRTVATFTGGFKRTHGAFRSGEFAIDNQGSHYGWMQHGVVISTLQPGLSTLLVDITGRVRMRTWTAADTRDLPAISHARQNGVPLIAIDQSSGNPTPGALVSNWAAGNWSGSAGGALRTVRGGACLQHSDAGDYLVYAYFSSATPSAMARVFQAYRCTHAMLLDMNALEHTYLALYRASDAGVEVQHLVRGMEEVDRRVGGQAVPRFIGYPDNRDFFYVMKRQEEEP